MTFNIIRSAKIEELLDKISSKFDKQSDFLEDQPTKDATTAASGRRMSIKAEILSEHVKKKCKRSLDWVRNYSFSKIKCS